MTIEEKKQSVRNALEALQEFQQKHPPNESYGKDMMALFAWRFLTMHRNAISDMLDKPMSEHIYDVALIDLNNILLVIASIIQDIEIKKKQQKVILN